MPFHTREYERTFEGCELTVVVELIDYPDFAINAVYGPDLTCERCKGTGMIETERYAGSATTDCCPCFGEVTLTKAQELDLYMALAPDIASDLTDDADRGD